MHTSHWFVTSKHPPEKSSNFVAVFSHFFPPTIESNSRLEWVTCILAASLGVKFNSMLKSRYKNKIVWIRIDLLFSFLTNFPEPSSLMTMKVCKEWINFYFCWIHQFELSHRIQIAELDQAKNPLVVSDTAFKNRNTRLCLQGFLKSDSRRSRINPLIVDVFWRGKIMFLLLTLMYKLDGIF